jgi:L-cysteine desulfidase
MQRYDETYQKYTEILKKELIPAMGCTEPIAVAYCAAKARSVLGCLPERVEVIASGNIIKNVKSVIVPNTDGAKGLEAAAGIGIIAGKEELRLEVVSQVTAEQKREFADWMQTADITVRQAEDGRLLSITVRVYAGGHSAVAKIADAHDRIVYLEKDGTVLLDTPLSDAQATEKPGYEALTVEGICQYAEIADLADVRETLDRQIAYNSAIAAEGLSCDYGANIGKVLLQSEGSNVRTRAKASAAAGSDARMNGCELPVVINSGSGNQGMTASLPVLEYGAHLKAEQETIYRALLVSNLLAIHIKTGIGCLSAYCGAVSAGAAAGAGVAWLQGGRFTEVAHTIVNALAVTSGIVCDGAKASCAAKIAISVEAGLLGYEMYQMGQQFYGGDGIVSLGVENTIRNICRLGHDGMRETDREILDIMTCVD